MFYTFKSKEEIKNHPEVETEDICYSVPKTGHKLLRYERHRDLDNEVLVMDSGCTMHPYLRVDDTGTWCFVHNANLILDIFFRPHNTLLDAQKYLSERFK